jgi:argininosuccinate lyase
MDTVRGVLRLSAGMLRQTRFNADVCMAAAADPSLLATDLADYLVRKGVPFREAHHAIGGLVVYAEKAGKPLNQLSAEEFSNIHPKLTPDAKDVFDLRRALARRNLIAAPGTRQVALQLARWKKVLSGKR